MRIAARRPAVRARYPLIFLGFPTSSRPVPPYPAFLSYLVCSQTQALGGLFSNHSPLLFVAMTVLITLVLTNFFSNTATLLVVSSLVSALSGPLVEAGYDITILAVAISLSSMVAYLTYASSGQAAILLSQKNMDNKFIWTYGIAAMLLYAAVVILVSAVCLFF